MSLPAYDQGRNQVLPTWSHMIGWLRQEHLGLWAPSTVLNLYGLAKLTRLKLIDVRITMGAFLSHLRRRGTSIDINPVLVLIIFANNLLESGRLSVVIVGPSAAEIRLSAVEIRLPAVEIKLSVVIAVVTIWSGAGQEGTVCVMPDIFVLIMSDG